MIICYHMGRKMKMIEIPKWPVADEKEEVLLKKVLSSNQWWRNAGTYVKRFEHEFAEYQGCKGGITVSNGTVALEIALKALGIGENDEVIVPDFTFYSTVSAVLAVKAIPVIVDTLHDSFCIDTEQIKRGITKRTKAIIPVHIAGEICDMDAICSIASEYGLYIIEDCSHAHGAVWNDRKAGSFGSVGTFSFQNAKLMTAGEGGIIVSNDQKILANALLEANCGRAEGDTSYQHVLIGTNARLSEFQGAILHAQLERFDEQVELRSKNYAYLSEKLSEIPGIKLQVIDKGMKTHPHYMIMFYYDSEKFNGASRAEFIEYLKDAGIPANRSYEAIHKLPVFKTLDKSSWRVIYSAGDQCVNSENISDHVVCLAHNILLGDFELISKIAERIGNFK